MIVDGLFSQRSIILMNGCWGTVQWINIVANTCTRQRPSHVVYENVHVRASTCLNLVSFALQVAKVARAFDPVYVRSTISNSGGDD